MFEIIGLISTINFIYEYINYQSTSIDRILDKIDNSEFLRNLNFNWFCKFMISFIFFITAINSLINLIERLEKKLR